MKFTELANFTINEKQLLAWNTLFDNRCKYLLYGGAAHGGKSYFLRWSAAGLGYYYSKKYGIKNVPIGLFSEDYPTLKDRQIARIKREFPPEMGELREDRDEGYMFEEADQRFKILLRNLDDPSKYASAEFAAVFVEELTKNPVETFEDLRFRLRYKDIGGEVKFVAATNPGQIGHAWVKKLWIEPDPKNPDREQDRFFFVKSLPTDNPLTTDEYMKQLQSLPEHKRMAWLEGRWDIFEGQVFTEWEIPERTVIPFKIPGFWKRYISIDWGSNKPFSVGWYAMSPDGRAYLYRELYMNGREFEAEYRKPLTARRLAKVILSINRRAQEKYEYAVGDPSMWNKILLGKKTDRREGESYAEVMINAGLKLIPGDNDKSNGMIRYREALSIAPDGKPWYQVFTTCYDTLRTIPSLPYDKHRVEDVDTDAEDHCYDRDRYFFMSRPAVSAKPIKKEKTVIQKAYAKAKRHETYAIDEALREWAQ